MRSPLARAPLVSGKRHPTEGGARVSGARKFYFPVSDEINGGIDGYFECERPHGRGLPHANGLLLVAVFNALAMKCFQLCLVRVQAADEDSARKAIPTVFLAAPDIADIRIADENLAAGFGIDAVIDNNFNSWHPTWSYSKSMASASSAAGGDCRPFNTFASSSIVGLPERGCGAHARL